MPTQLNRREQRQQSRDLTVRNNVTPFRKETRAELDAAAPDELRLPRREVFWGGIGVNLLLVLVTSAVCALAALALLSNSDLSRWLTDLFGAPAQARGTLAGCGVLLAVIANSLANLIGPFHGIHDGAIRFVTRLWRVRAVADALSRASNVGSDRHNDLMRAVGDAQRTGEWTRAHALVGMFTAAALYLPLSIAPWLFVIATPGIGFGLAASVIVVKALESLWALSELLEMARCTRTCGNFTCDD